MKQLQWSPLQFGMQHFPDGPIAGEPHRATVTDFGECAEVLCWYPGCQFSPKSFMFSTMAEAKAAGEAYVRSEGAEMPRPNRTMREVVQC